LTCGAKLRPGRNADSAASNAANYDEAKANPYAHWLDHQGSFMAAVAAQPVFRLLGARDLGRSDDYLGEKMPDVHVDLLDGALAWRQHDGGHTDDPNIEHFVMGAQARREEDDNRSPVPQRDGRSLKAAVGDRFKLGVGVSHVVVRQPEDAALIETHIHTVVERYADATTAWDVVNEAIGDGEEGLLRDSVYSRTTGLDFIVTAFKAARASDPDALLIYNDYNGHKPGKREKLIELLTQLRQQGAPVDAYGMQGHFELGDDSIPQLRETFDELRKLGLKVVVSELDIDVVTRGRWWAEGGKYRDELATYDPYKDRLPDEIQQQQLEQYVALFRLFDEYSDLIERVSFWNLHDGQSWLNYFPWRRVNHPLLFDRDRRPKPVFDAVYALFETPRSTHRIVSPLDFAHVD
jgi:GH35 family endo-1,4-beta-xylanase